MSIGLLFWLLMVLWLVFGVCAHWPSGSSGPWGFVPFGGTILLWILLFLLGWHSFGFIIHG